MTLYKDLVAKWRYFAGVFFYARYFPLAYAYTRKRDRLEKRYRAVAAAKSQHPGWPDPGSLTDARASERGCHITFERTELLVDFLADDLVRLDWQSAEPPVPYGIHKRDWPVVETSLEATGSGGWTVKSTALSVTVSRDGQVRFEDAAGRLLRQENPPTRRPGEGWVHQVPLQPEEHIYGLGERAFPLNLRNASDEQGQAQAFRLWNFDMAGRYGVGADPLYICIALYMGLHAQGSYLVFYENSFPGTVVLQERATLEFEGGPLRYYVMAGPPTTLLERYTELTGRAPLPPLWALGYHQSHWGYENEVAVRNTAQAFQIHNLPLSGIHLDIDCLEGFKAFTLDAKRFPYLREFNEDLQKRGVRLINIINPGVQCSPDYQPYREGLEKNIFCTTPEGEVLTAPVWPGWCAFPDYSNPEARHWWSQQYKALLAQGISGFWHDMNEPAAFVTSGDRSLPPHATRHYLEGRGGDHNEVHNLYGLLQAQAGYEGLCEFHPDRRPFIVSRAGWAGLQRYAWTWTGDVDSSWPALRGTIATVLGLGLSGIPYSGADIGGFQGNPTPELYLRWLQMGTFLTFYRTHSSNNVRDRTPWGYGEPLLSIIRDFLQLRYRLLPYFYSLSWEANQSGVPHVRPLFWYHQEEAWTWAIDDIFYLGNALLICPVVEPGARTRTLKLPEGSWYLYWDDELVSGPGTITLDAPLERIPVLVRAGSILPMAESAMEDNRKIIWHLYLPESGTYEFTHYSDAGDGYGPSRLDRLRLVRSEVNTLELFWEASGEYPAQSYYRVQLHGAQCLGATVDEREVTVENNGVEVQPFGRLRLQLAPES